MTLASWTTPLGVKLTVGGKGGPWTTITNHTPPARKGYRPLNHGYRCTAAPARFLSPAELERAGAWLPRVRLVPPQTDRSDAARVGVADNEALHDELALYHGPF